MFTNQDLKMYIELACNTFGEKRTTFFGFFGLESMLAIHQVDSIDPVFSTVRSIR